MCMGITRHVVFHGTVQGVNFRRQARGAAIGLGVGGWVRNLPDGTVEGEFSGSAESVERLIDYCTKGMMTAKVEKLEITDLQFAEYSGFEIRR